MRLALQSTTMTTIVIKDIAVMVGIALPEFKFQGGYSLSGSQISGSILAKYGKYAKVTTC